MGRRSRRLRASVCRVLLAAPAVLAELPSQAEYDRAVACGDENRYLDFTKETSSESLPPCTVRCQFRTESIGGGSDPVPGDVRACVWRRTGSTGYRMRFGLHFRCQESECAYLGRWHFFHQMTGVKIAHLLGIPLSEVKSAFLYWVADSFPQPGIPRLQKFLVRRSDEANITRRLDADDPWYVLFIAFRVDSARLDPTSRSVAILRENNIAGIERAVGVGFEVQNFEFSAANVTAEEAADFPNTDFQPVYVFQGKEPNETPESLLHGEVGGVAGADRERARGCLDSCHMVHETGNELGPYRCRDDCECNGERWCSHMGLCVGETPVCRVEEVTTTLAPTTTVGSGRGQVQQPSGGGGGGGHAGGANGVVGGGPNGVVVTTTAGPLSQLSRGCYDTVIGAWQSCTDHGGCQELECNVVQAVTDAAACHQDICNSQVFLDRWLSLCSVNATRSAFDEQVRQCWTTPPPTTTPLPTVLVKETIAGGLSMILLWVGLAALFVCMSMVAVKVLMARHKWSDSRLWRGSIAFLRRCTAKMMRRNVVVVPNPEAEQRRGSIASSTSSASYKAQYLPKKGQKEQKEPPGTPPKMTSKGSFKTPPHPSGQPWSTTGSPWYAAANTATPPPSTSPWPSPGSVFQTTKEAWSPPPERSDPSPVRPVPPRSPSRIPWKTPFRRNSMPNIQADAEKNANSPDSYTNVDEIPRMASKDSTSSGGPISPRKLSKELQQVRKGVTKQQLLQISSPKSLRKELSRQRETCTLAERRRLFKDLLLRWHPDKNAGDELRAAEMFQTLQECKEWFFSDD